MKKVLLHICCGVCAFYCIEYLKNAGFLLEGYFYNPNLNDEEEYLKRKYWAEKVAQITGIKLWHGDYEFKTWLNQCQAYANEPEGGKRCLICYELRLKKTFLFCQENNFDFFTTTLTISPYKNSQDIFKIGKNLNAEKFLALDFKKDSGFQKTINLAKKYNIYRQNYCGCIYSKKI